MDFDFSDDEKMVQDQINRFLTDQCDFSVHRSVLEGDEAYSSKVWRGLSDMGVQGTAIAGAYGGVEAGYLTLCLAAQSLGAHLAPVPFSSSIYLAAEAISQFGSEDQKQQWLPKLASGEVIGTVAVNESNAEPDKSNIAVSFSDGVLNGIKQIVPHGLIADIAVVLASTDKGLKLVIAELERVARTPLDTVDPTMASATLNFKDCTAEVLAEADDGWQALDLVYDRAAVLYAFEQLGGAQRALDMAVNYAQERFAFGRPIGSFQALKHMMADMYVALKLAESNCFYAAWALENNSDDLALAAATARVSATQAFQLCSRDNIQVHGGMGFTWEFDCHLYYRRSNYLTLVLGGFTVWEDKLIRALPDAA